MSLQDRLEDLSTEQQSFAAGAIALIVVNLVGNVAGLEFPLRTIVAIGAGFIALMATSYVLSGNLIPEGEEDEEYEPEF